MRIFKIIFLTLFVSVGIAAKAQNPSNNTVVKTEKKDFRTKADLFYQKINEQQEPQILDARTEEEFEQAHLPKAIQVDPAIDGYEKAFDRLIKNSPVFIYSIQTGRSTKIANLLKDQGFENIYVLSPGISAWIGAGYPVVASANNRNRIVLNDFKTALKSQQYVLVDYGSNYCAPCKKVIPVLDSLNRTSNNKIKTIQVQIDANPEIIKEFKITTLPTIILYKDGTPVWEKIGIPSVTEIIEASITK
ncbi:thioredoxin domain-containing protein [Sphingobacterium sp. SRCM116780]|uniref:thioredoxin domain-containing protein n=1 Tax=Sphingobacterium sp. SRCM116780 TaxID=2907623 RepID=UPI001F1ABD6D|nr:thioredoxin domain-containing protein [Sphingobacterium sp. SRCM116780]UIR57614.1 thioredoxin domain-containing protein [Sphingobacterium sp. SRCM116780]